MVHAAQSPFSSSSRIVEVLLFALPSSFSVLLKILKLERRVLPEGSSVQASGNSEEFHEKSKVRRNWNEIK